MFALKTETKKIIFRRGFLPLLDGLYKFVHILQAPWKLIRFYLMSIRTSRSLCALLIFGARLSWKQAAVRQCLFVLIRPSLQIVLVAECGCSKWHFFAYNLSNFICPWTPVVLMASIQHPPCIAASEHGRACDAIRIYVVKRNRRFDYFSCWNLPEVDRCT